MSEDKNTEVQLTGYLVKKLPWERSTLTSIKKKLDQAYLKGLQPRLRAIVLQRRRHPDASNRGRPVDLIDWAVRPATSMPTPSTTEQPVTPLPVRQQSPNVQPAITARTASPEQVADSPLDAECGDYTTPSQGRSLTTPTYRPAADLASKRSVSSKKKIRTASRRQLSKSVSPLYCAFKVLVNQ